MTQLINVFIVSYDSTNKQKQRDIAISKPIVSEHQSK